MKIIGDNGTEHGVTDEFQLFVRFGLKREYVRWTRSEDGWFSGKGGIFEPFHVGGVDHSSLIQRRALNSIRRETTCAEDSVYIIGTQGCIFWVIWGVFENAHRMLTLVSKTCVYPF